MMRHLVLILALANAAGCATSAATAMVAVDARPETKQTEGAGVRVGLVRIYNDIITCEVVNLGRDPVLVDRDAVVMVTPSGERRARLPGGAQSTYGIPGSSSHVVNVRYDLDGVLDDDVVQLDFSHAILRDGQPLAAPLPPLVIKPKQQTP
jgi:hypothetical protein